MYPNTGEWVQILFLVVGPFHVLFSVILTGFAWWLAPRWSMPVRVTVLAANVVLAIGPLLTGLAMHDTDKSIEHFGFGLAVCELVSVLGLAAVMIGRRSISP